MEVNMKQKHFLSPGLILTAAMQLLVSCAVQGGSRNAPALAGISAVRTGSNSTRGDVIDQAEMDRIHSLLDQIAELERSGLFRPGMAMTESMLRERLGDYGGATLAAYKEMSWAYGHGDLPLEQIVWGLERVAALEDQPEKESAVQAALAVLAFVQERWDEAGQRLITLSGGPDEEPDSFIRWMLLSCSLEKDPADRRAVSAYRAIRARYAKFPEYWYRGAKVFSDIIASEYAEYCIDLAPRGPFATECRVVLASFSGLGPENGPAIKSKTEIEELIAQAVNMGNPGVLEPLMPLIGLPENPFTVYAIGALKSLAAIPHFRDYFDGLAARSRGRLAERLVYICRG
jgi:hypothetical protein